MPKKLDLVGVSEVKEMLGVSRQRVHQLMRDYEDFPDPVAELASGRIWMREDVEAWARQRGRPHKGAGKVSWRPTT